MSFNVSRFLVRMRRFWTRERLVPVLGAAALFLFGLNFYQYLSAKFGDDPIVARHVVINGEVVESFDMDFDAETAFFFGQFDHGDHNKRWHHKEWTHRHWDHEFDADHDHDLFEEAHERHSRKIKELKERLKEHQRFEIRSKVLKFKSDDDNEIIIMNNQDDDEDVIIMGEKDGESFEITINGKKIQVKKDKEI